jgi:predicted nucleic-acid-binding protein
MKSRKGIDTNVLVRYITQDDPEQSRQATQFIEKTSSSEESSIFITGIVLCELVWVLETAYKYHKENIAKVLEKILRTRQFCVYQPEILWNCLHDYQHINIDFADSYIGHLNASNECEYTVTFDKKATRLKCFKQLGDKDN